MQNKQIMIVEDEVIVAEDLQETLEGFGYDVVGVEDTGEKAIQTANNSNPDLILMDIMLKGNMTGIQAASDIGQKSDVPIIYLTAYTDNDTAQKAINTNPSGYLVKPFNRKTLYASIEIALQKRKARENFNLKKETNELDSKEGLVSNTENVEISKSGIEKSETTVSPKGNIENSEKTNTSEKDAPHIIKSLRKYDLTLMKLLDELREESINQFNLNKLIECSYKLAIFNVRKNLNRIYNINKKWELSIEDIAIESISTLFITNEKRSMLNLRYSLLKWNNNINNDLDALYFLHKTISISVNQYINKLIKDSDPVFARVLDSINHFIKRHNFKKTNYFGTTYIMDETLSEITYSPISPDEFQSLPISYNEKSRKHVIYKVLDYLDTETDYYPAIPLNSLIKQIIENYKCFDVNDYTTVHAPVGQIYVDDIMQTAYDKVIMKLHESYLDKNKLTVEEVNLIKEALKDIAYDLKEAQLNWGLYNYIQTYDPELTKEEYKEKYQNILEYLVKKLKHFVKQQLN